MRKTNLRWGAALVLALVLVAVPAAAQEKTEFVNGQEAVANEALVKFRAMGGVEFSQLLAQHNVDQAQNVGSAGVVRLHSRSQTAAALVRDLGAHPKVIYAEPNFILHAANTPNDPQFGQLYGLRNTGQTIQGTPGTAGADISATAAWDVTTGSRNVAAGIIDTGIDYNHADLAANVWSAPVAFSVTFGTTTISCAAGTHGFNAINNTCDPLDDNGHGTHTAGTIGAAGNNATGVVGVNWTTSILAGKFLNASGSGSTANAINAIDFMIQVKAQFGAQGANVRVLSNSWGGTTFSQALLDEINLANSNEMLFVAAAGNSATNNDTTPFYPANYNAPNVVGVAATDNNDALASFSNFGATTVHLGAPGVNILSTYKGGYAYLSGTSMATPQVSGAALLVLSVCTLTTAQLKSDILNNVDAIGSLSGKTITGGRLNANKAVTACAPALPNFSLSASPASQSINPGGGTSYTVSVSALNGFSGTVGFSVAGLPSGASASFSPTTVSGSGSTTMSITTAASTPAGAYPLTITGTSGALVRNAQVTLNLVDFTVAASPASQSVSPGAGTSFTVSIAALGGFAGPVGFGVSGLPTGAGASFSPTSVTGSGSTTMSITTSASTPVGSYPLTITATSGSLAHTAQVTLNVATGPPDFTIGISPASQTFVKGASVNYTVTITALNGFSGTVSFSLSGQPTFVYTASFSPATVTGSGTSTLTLSSLMHPDTFPMVVTGTSGSLSHSADFSFTTTLTATPDFTLGASPASQSVNQGASTTYTVSIAALGGFSGVVSFGASGLPSGAGASFSPATITGSGSTTMTVTTAATTPAGTYPLTITGTSGGLVHSAQVSLSVTGLPDFTVSITPASQSFPKNTSVNYSVTITALNGFNGTVSFSLSGQPTYAYTASFSPATVTGSGTSTMTLSSAMHPDTFPMVLTATSGSLSHSVNFSFTTTF